MGIRGKRSELLATVGLFLLLTGCASSQETDPLAEAFSQIELQEYGEAQALLSGIVESESGSRKREALRGAGIACIGEGKYDEAINNLEQALALSSGILNDMDFDINYYLATAFYKKGDTDEALSIYEAILTLRPEEADAHYLSGVIYAERGLSEEAKESFDQCIALEPENYDRLIRIYNVLSENGLTGIGQIYLKNAMEDGGKRMTNYEKGQISFYLEDYESARTYLEKAGEETGAEAVLLLGKTYETLGDNNYAISVYSTYLSSGEDSPQIRNEMGLCKMAMGDYEGALREFRAAIELPENPLLQTLRFNEIAACEYMGDFAQARTLLESYLKSFPDDENAKREYVFLKTR